MYQKSRQPTTNVSRSRHPTTKGLNFCVTATQPLETVCMDFMTLEPSERNIKDVLVLTDYFTKYMYAVAVPMKN